MIDGFGDRRVDESGNGTGLVDLSLWQFLKNGIAQVIEAIGRAAEFRRGNGTFCGSNCLTVKGLLIGVGQAVPICGSDQL